MTEEASADVVFHNAYVVTMDGALMVLRNGAIAVVGDHIAALGPSADVLAAFPRAAQTLDLAGRILLPGWCFSVSSQTLGQFWVMFSFCCLIL
jgi:predicted amidohydrolase YtcJ